MKRQPGYILDLTMAHKRDILGECRCHYRWRIDIYNNTQELEELVLDDYVHVNFQYTF